MSKIQSAVTGPLPALPSFAEFYRAVNGYPPFPWQRRLADQVDATGEWPDEIGVPTGLGKTSCLDIAVWWLAAQAGRPPHRRSAPTRIWWVVNRRLLVDSTAEHATRIKERIECALKDPESAPADRQARAVLAAVGCRLGFLSADPSAPPLDVIRLRGGVSSRSPRDPSCPTILLCTLPMFGSRLLFRGYGSMRRPVDAAMAGTDSMVLLDEAHLAPHLKTLLPALAECAPGARPFLQETRSRPRLVTLTATGDAAGRRFDLDQEDDAHPIVRERLDAAKLLEIREESGDAGNALAETARDLILESDAPVSCLVFANTPKTARGAFDRLRAEKRLKGSQTEVLLLTGRVREREAERLRHKILDAEHGMAADRSTNAARERHLIVVATQTLEVGADIDAEILVTECCGARALTQRLGRFNRLGRHPKVRAAYVHLPPLKRQRRGSANGGTGAEEWPVYGEEPKFVLQRLTIACGKDKVVNVPPRDVAAILGPPRDNPGRAPEILPGILWEWVKTTTPPEGEAPVEPYFSGIAAPAYAVSIIWRVHVQEAGKRLWPSASDREAIDIPIAEAREALTGETVCRLGSDGVTLEKIASEDLRPGDRVVLPTERGLMDEFGWNPYAAGPVVDVSLARHGLPLDARAIERLCEVSIPGRTIDTALGFVEGDEEADAAERKQAVAHILQRIRESGTPAGWESSEWKGFVESLSDRVHQDRQQRQVARLPVARPDREPRNDEFDEMSLTVNGAVPTLDAHGRDVGSRAAAIARKLELPAELVDVVARAARLHDIGKADDRFQRWLNPDGKHRGQVAKSETPRHRWEATRAASGWPRGGRHEDLSARLVQAWLDRVPDWGSEIERDLLMHLVVSHHGKGRPLVLPVADSSVDTVHGMVKGLPVEAPADLAIVDWRQPARFRRLNDQFGPWGLALLEAIVIRADNAVSAGADALREEPVR